MAYEGFENNGTVPLEGVLKELGFKNEGSMLVFDFGNFKLQGSQIHNYQFREVFDFFGCYVNSDRAGVLEFKLPIKVESFEQGVAFLAFFIGKAHFSIKPGWLSKGLEWSSHLPWVKERMEYENIPKAMIDRDWCKLIVNKIIALAAIASTTDLTTFSFDGEVLKIVCCNEKIICAASGKAWQSTVAVNTKSLSSLPKRIKKNGIFYIYVWKNNLHIINYVFEKTDFFPK